VTNQNKQLIFFNLRQDNTHSIQSCTTRQCDKSNYKVKINNLNKHFIKKIKEMEQFMIICIHLYTKMFYIKQFFKEKIFCINDVKLNNKMPIPHVLYIYIYLSALLFIVQTVEIFLNMQFCMYICC